MTIIVLVVVVVTCSSTSCSKGFSSYCYFLLSFVKYFLLLLSFSAKCAECLLARVCPSRPSPPSCPVQDPDPRGEVRDHLSGS